jgi:hypothetical protein
MNRGRGVHRRLRQTTTAARTTGEPDVARRFPISFGAWYRVLSTVVGVPPSGAYVAVGREHIEVRMSWAFRSRFPRSAIQAVFHSDVRPLSRGVHGFRGRWLVNGSGTGILTLQLDPAQRAYVVGFPVRLRELLVSVEEPAALAAAFHASA